MNDQIEFMLAAGVAGGPLGSPVADANAGGSETDVINISKHHDCYFLLLFGARSGSTAAPVITVNSCDNTTPSNSTAMAFEYRLVSSLDTNAAWTAVASTGLTVTTGDDFAIIVHVKAANVTSGRKYVQMVLTEPENDPQVMACLVMLANPRFAQDTGADDAIVT